MGLTQTQKDNVAKVKAFLDLIKKICPDISRLTDLVNRLTANVESDLIHFDTKAVESQPEAASAPAYTKNKKDIYIREDVGGTSAMDLSTPGGIGDLINLFATLVHEMFHQLCSDHPKTYEETSDFLKEVIKCLKDHKDETKSAFTGMNDTLFNGLIDQLETHKQSEADFAKAKDKPKDSNCSIATAVYGTELEPEVQLLMRYRDQCLRQNRGGQVFINVYETLSPKFVTTLRRSHSLRSIVRFVFVRPALACARRGLRLKSAQRSGIS